RKYPLVLFLHSETERGDDNRRQLKTISEWTRDEIQGKHPCFIVAPQCPNWKEVFQVYGHSDDLAATTIGAYSSANQQWKHFQIPAGRRTTGKTNWLFFINDDWGKPDQVESLFRNVRIYESGSPARAKAVDF